jgi:hypothetical protein
MTDVNERVTSSVSKKEMAKPASRATKEGERA